MRNKQVIDFKKSPYDKMIDEQTVTLGIGNRIIYYCSVSLFVILAIVTIVFVFKLSAEPNNFSDYIISLTAPLLSLIGSILVFFALKAQIEANRFMIKNVMDLKSDDNEKQEIDRFVNRLNFIKKEIEELDFSEIIETAKGKKCIAEFLEHVLNESKNGTSFKRDELMKIHNKIYQIKVIIYQLNSIFNTISKVAMSEENKMYLNDIFYVYFENNIRLSLYKVKVDYNKFEKNNLDKGNENKLKSRIYEILVIVDNIYQSIDIAYGKPSNYSSYPTDDEIPLTR